MNTELLKKKIETLVAFREWMPSQRHNFLWGDGCSCWMPMLPRFLGYYVERFGACVLMRAEVPGAGDAVPVSESYFFYKHLYPGALQALEDVGISYWDLANFEFLIRYWDGKSYKEGVTAGYTYFDNGLTYVDEWIAHLKSELEKQREPITIAPIVDEVSDTITSLILETA